MCSVLALVGMASTSYVIILDKTWFSSYLIEFLVKFKDLSWISFCVIFMQTVSFSVVIYLFWLFRL